VNIKALSVDRDIDLALFSRYLYQSSVLHRINEVGAEQEIWVNSELDKQKIQSLYGAFSRGEFELQDNGIRSERASIAAQLAKILKQAAASPFILTLILANVICFPITLGIETGNQSQWLAEFTLLSFNVMNNQIYHADLAYTLDTHQYWRLITPMLLHFGWLHIVFNLLWVWEIGRRIEQLNGSLVVFLLTLTTSVTANLLQYWMEGASLFGGMSGVVYGFLGFGLCISRLAPSIDLVLPKAIYGVMLGFLILGFTGVIDLLGLGNLANGAHLGGLLAGMVCAIPVALSAKIRAKH
jgi:GlpG protein